MVQTDASAEAIYRTAIWRIAHVVTSGPRAKSALEAAYDRGFDDGCAYCAHVAQHAIVEAEALLATNQGEAHGPD